MPYVLEAALGLLSRSAEFAIDARSLIGIVAAVLAAVLAARASWTITDRIIAWRDRDEV